MLGWPVVLSSRDRPSSRFLSSHAPFAAPPMAGSSERPFYGKARIAAGLLLVGLAGVLMVIDAISLDYMVDSIQLGLILGTGLLFLGVEAGRRLLGP